MTHATYNSARGESQSQSPDALSRPQYVTRLWALTAVDYTWLVSQDEMETPDNKLEHHAWISAIAEHVVINYGKHFA